MADRAASQQVLVLLAVQVVVLVITGLQQAAQQGHLDKVLLAAITSALLHTHPAGAAAHLRLAQMARVLRLARAAQGLHHQSPDHL
jgi:hypothetical protein